MTEDSDSDIVREERHVAPAHYTMKIDTFLFLSEMAADADTDLVNYESRVFEASGHKWKLVLFPNGDKSRLGDGYISLYLVMADTNGLAPGWEINATFKFFVYDQLQDKYLTIGDGRLRRFCAIKKEWGVPQLLPLSVFKDASNGYLIGDSCVFGVEVFVLKNEGKGELFSIIKDPSGGTFTWEVENFSKLKEEFYLSQVYSAEGHQWRLKLFPNGNNKQRGENLSLFFEVVDHFNFQSGWKLFVEFTLRIKDQVQSNHHEKTLHKWFNASVTDWGLYSFIPLTDIRKTPNSFIVNDTLIVEGELNRLSVLKDFA